VRRFFFLLACIGLGAGLVGCGGDDDSPDAASDGDEGDGGGGGQRYEFVGTALESEDHGPELCLGGVADSLPPQCGGVAVDPWNWDDVPGAQSASGTTWVDSVRVVGTYDSDTFRPTEKPGAPTGLGGPAVDVMADYPPLCTPEATDPAKTSDDAFMAVSTAADSLPTRSAFWVSRPSQPVEERVINVIVTGDAAGATAELQALWGGGLCVVERPETPTEAQLNGIQGQLTDVLGVDVWSSWTDPTRGVVVAQVTLATDEVRAAAEAAYGAGVIELNPTLKPL
jgi:hypothetical protein